MFEGILQPTHLAIILVIVMIIFGPGKLAGMGRTLGQSVRELREGAAGIDSTQTGTVAPAAATVHMEPVVTETSTTYVVPIGSTIPVSSEMDVAGKVPAGHIS
ncbi:MAG: twin-arginine translocase TatA/TatE family subunit [Chloroflexota bacterium]|nr:twin-arginine translocase TatA/TatE family subunit [Chloroflexota bacterium]